MPEPKVKMRVCRACGKDCKVGEPCENCEWDEEEARKRVRGKILLDEIEKEEREELEKSKKESKKGDKKGWFNT